MKEDFVRASVEEQELRAALQVSLSTEEEMLDAVLTLLMSDVVLPEMNQHHVVAREARRDKEYGSVERKIRHDVADALPGSSDALLTLVLEFLTENTLTQLTSGHHRPSHMREDLAVKELSGSVAAFCLQMGMNRRTDAVEGAEREQRYQENEHRKDIARGVREKRRNKMVGSRDAQKKMLAEENGGGGNFGSGARSARPSVILDRARKRLLDDMARQDKEEEREVEVSFN
jgi:hypothetical protein